MSAEASKVREQLRQEAEKIAERLMGADYREGGGKFLLAISQTAWGGAARRLGQRAADPKGGDDLPTHLIAIMIAGMIAQEHLDVPPEDLELYRELAGVIYRHGLVISALEPEPTPREAKESA